MGPIIHISYLEASSHVNQHGKAGGMSRETVDTGTAISCAITVSYYTISHKGSTPKTR